MGFWIQPAGWPGRDIGRGTANHEKALIPLCFQAFWAKIEPGRRLGLSWFWGSELAFPHIIFFRISFSSAYHFNLGRPSDSGAGRPSWISAYHFPRISFFPHIIFVSGLYSATAFPRCHSVGVAPRRRRAGRAGSPGAPHGKA